jgi:transcriptional regulator with XRE-family HTH domain
MSDDREAFGSHLRLLREQRGITLKAIAESTKLKESLLAALERGNLSQWPQGIFRRAYIRDYASAIGLPAQSVVDEFNRLFPDDDACCDLFEIAKSELFEDKPRFYQSLREKSPIVFRPELVRAAIFDVAAVFTMCGLLAGVSILNIWTLVGAVALCYYTLGTACLGRSVGSWLLGRTDGLFTQTREHPALPPQAPEFASTARHKPPRTASDCEAVEKPPRRASA